MNKKILLIHRVIFSVNVILLAASLVFYLFRWHELPSEIGMHFDPDGNFDVVSSKIYGFYPHLIGSLILTGTAFDSHLIQKKSTGLQISEKGERLFKAELLLTLDCFASLL